MIRITNLSHMTVLGWEKRYSEILKEFGYSKKSDLESAKLLNSLLKNKFPLNKLRSKVFEQNVFVIGAGPSLLSCIPVLKRFSFITKIVADGAAKALIENNIIPDILVTDLDGDEKSSKKIGKGKTIMVVHSHGDNLDKLELVSKFKNCIGTTEAKTFGKIHNFGGFTDGDRCVFLAKHFKSKTKITSKKTKIKKLRHGKKLLEWIASKNSSDLYTTSKPIKGFKKIYYNELESVLADENAFEYRIYLTRIMEV